jgi:hypothetical protein
MTASFAGAGACACGDRDFSGDVEDAGGWYVMCFE